MPLSQLLVSVLLLRLSLRRPWGSNGQPSEKADK